MIKNIEYETTILPFQSIIIDAFDYDTSAESEPLLKKIKSNSAAGSIIQHTFGV